MSNLHERLSELATNVRDAAILAETVRRNPDNVPSNTTPYRMVIDHLKKLIQRFDNEGETFQSPPNTNSAILKRQNVTFRMAPRIDMRGISWTLQNDVTRNRRLSPLIHVHHVDPERDKHLKRNLSSYNLNYIFADVDERDYQLKFSRPPDPKFLPTSVDLRPTFGNILDQSTLGAPAVHAVAYSLRFLKQKIDKKNAWTPSRLYMYWYARKAAELPTDVDTGVSIRHVFQAISHNGVCPESSMPYDVDTYNMEPSRDCQELANKFPKVEYYTVEQTSSVLKKCLKDGYPVNFACIIFSGFMTEDAAKTGNIPIPNDDQQKCGCHTLTIVGHDESEKVFFVANSWGSDWGDNGFCKMPYGYVLDSRYASDFWTCRLIQ